MKTIIMAGGKGTRIASVNLDVPKPMLEVAGKPILLWQIESLVSQGFTDILITVGYLGPVIVDYFGNGSAFGCDIAYVTENEPLGTAGALFYLKETISDDFLLINGDIIFGIDVARFREFHIQHGGNATIFTHPNSHPYDSGIIVADSNYLVTQWLHREDERKWYKNRVNAGVHILSPEVFEYFDSKPKKLDLDRDILQKLIPRGELFCYDSPEYVKDMGTPERYKQVEADIESGLVKAKNLKNKQRALFLDRDGTINKHVGFLRDIDDFELNEGIVDVIGKANKDGRLVIVVTNQPVIARGEVTWEQLGEIHNKMETLLGERGVYVDAIYVCPHHPDKGFEGERVEYKINCDCRKPKPGMLLRAAEKYNIDLSQSEMIGDSDADLQAGNNAGIANVCVVSF
jgi:D-glycero-D-manno-heptose 1,7-bisphosphate phosphatase